MKIGLNIGAGNDPYADNDETKWFNLEPFYVPGHPDYLEVRGRYNVLAIKGQDIADHFAGDSVDVIHIVHALEHIPTEEADEVIEKCYKVLKSGGYIEIETPDLDKACALWLNGDQSDRVLGLFYGGRRENPGQLHLTGFNLERYKKLLGSFGFKDITEIPVGEGHGKAEPEYDIRVRAVK